MQRETNARLILEHSENVRLLSTTAIATTLLSEMEAPPLSRRIASMARDFPRSGCEHPQTLRNLTGTRHTDGIWHRRQEPAQ